MRLSTEEKQALVSRYQAGESVTEICADTGISRSTFYTWIKPYTTTTTDSGHVVNQQEFMKMKQRIQKLEQKVKILQKVGYTASAPLQEKLQELSKLYGQYSNVIKLVRKETRQRDSVVQKRANGIEGRKNRQQNRAERTPPEKGV